MGTLSTKNFEHYFKQLLEYESKHGTLTVPNTTHKNDEYFLLGVWCTRIRKCRRNYDYNKTLPPDAPEKDKKKVGQQISEVTIRRLDEIGFDWGYKGGTAPPKSKTFEEWFVELTSFHDMHGHCNVPAKRCSSNEYSSLANWCYRIRVAYRAYKQHKENPDDEALKAKMKNVHPLDEDRLKRLGELGFEYDTLA